MQINDIFHNCTQEQQQQQQSNSKDLGSKCPRSKKLYFCITTKKLDFISSPILCGKAKNNPCILELNTDFFLNERKSQLKQVLKFCTKTYNQINKFLKEICFSDRNFCINCFWPPRQDKICQKH